MALLPELEPLLDRIHAAGAPDHAASVTERREQVHAGIELQQAHMVEPVPAAPRVDHRVSVDGGEITVRLYRPDVEGTVGCHFYVHGGGWWMGTLDQSDLACSRIVQGVGDADFLDAVTAPRSASRINAESTERPGTAATLNAEAESDSHIQAGNQDSRNAP